MGIYLNPDHEKYQETVNGEVFVDKSLLIEYTNKVMKTPAKNICVSRPRRFGKSTDANMLAAYYSKGSDSSELFQSLNIAKTKDYCQHLNQYNVIHLDIQSFLSLSNTIEEMLQLINDLIIDDLREVYEQYMKYDKLPLVLSNIYAKTKEQFIFIIDEWDCIFREYKVDKESQRKYLDYLRLLLKDKPYVALVYMTGILPIKKYGTHSALNMFKEISMLNPTPLENYMGFTEEEVRILCNKYEMDYEKIKEWYDGYQVGPQTSIYNHRSVVYAMMDRKYENYWTSTETYEALQVYIDMNFDGLKDDIIRLLAGESVSINYDKFQNDMTTFKSKDDVLTLLVHLGYLGYKQDQKKVYIPNKEVSSAFINSIEDSDWQETTKALLNSNDLLEATWQGKEEKVAQYIEEAHLHTSIIQYNDENALSYTLSLAYYTARDEYTIIREMPSGKGYADLVFIPKKDKPAMVVELKWNKDAYTAIDQIKEKKYMHGLEHYLGSLLLVGISYDKATKKHECIIKKYKN